MDEMSLLYYDVVDLLFMYRTFVKFPSQMNIKFHGIFQLTIINVHRILTSTYTYY